MDYIIEVIKHYKKYGKSDEEIMENPEQFKAHMIENLFGSVEINTPKAKKKKDKFLPKRNEININSPVPSPISLKNENNLPLPSGLKGGEDDEDESFVTEEDESPVPILKKNIVKKKTDVSSGLEKISFDKVIENYKTDVSCIDYCTWGLAKSKTVCGSRDNVKIHQTKHIIPLCQPCSKKTNKNVILKLIDYSPILKKKVISSVSSKRPKVEENTEFIEKYFDVPKEPGMPKLAESDESDVEETNVEENMIMFTKYSIIDPISTEYERIIKYEINSYIFFKQENGKEIITAILEEYIDCKICPTDNSSILIEGESSSYETKLTEISPYNEELIKIITEKLELKLYQFKGEGDIFDLTD